MTDQTIAKALYHFLESQLSPATVARRFFRLDGFGDTVYGELLARFATADMKIGATSLIVRTTAPIPNFERYALETDKSATWHRNNVSAGCALVLLFNRRTSDVQGLQNIFAITETILANEGFVQLRRACFILYQLNPQDAQVIDRFVSTLRHKVFEPQLRDLADFLSTLDRTMHDHALPVEQAIARAVPCLGLFRCDELATVLGTPRLLPLLQKLYSASRLGTEILEDRKRLSFLQRLEQAQFPDDQEFSGHSAREKREYLRRFLLEVIVDRAVLLETLKIDWRDVSEVLVKKGGGGIGKNPSALGGQLRQKLSDVFPDEVLPPQLESLIGELCEGRTPDAETLQNLVEEYEGVLGKPVVNAVRKIAGIKERRFDDFLVGVAHVAIELLGSEPRELVSGSTLQVTVEENSLPKEPNQVEGEALAAFRTLYGGVEGIFSTVKWGLDPLWSAIEHCCDWHNLDVAGAETGKVEKVEFVFKVALTGPSGKVLLGPVALVWQYRSDSPASTTLFNLLWESRRLDGTGRLAVPIYNTCPNAEELNELDIQRPRHSFGTWFRNPGSLREALKVQFGTAKAKFVQVEEPLCALESTWGAFVRGSLDNGTLAADATDLLARYEAFLGACCEAWQSDLLAKLGYRELVKAWMVGPETWASWAVMPFVHPLKLHWWRERARALAELVARLVGVGAQAVDAVRLRKELETIYSSRGFPAVVALPDKQGSWPYMVTVEEAHGYGLYRRLGSEAPTLGLDASLLAGTEARTAAQIAAETLARVVRDYVETYPFTRDGLEVYLVQARNGALPGLLVEKATKLLEAEGQGVRLNIVAHSTDQGAALFARVSEWLEGHEQYRAAPAGGYFPPITLKVLECNYQDLFDKLEDVDLVILVDVLAEQGQQVETEVQRHTPEDVSLEGHFPLYAIRQQPFQRGHIRRQVQLTPQIQPRLMRFFYNVQWAANRQKTFKSDQHVDFLQEMSLNEWEQTLARLHTHFNWVVCYDTTIDRFLLEDTFAGDGAVQVIRFSQGLGLNQKHSLTVSSSYKAQDVVVRRLNRRLAELLPGIPEDARQRVAKQTVLEAKGISGDIVLRAAGPGAYVNELLGLVVAKWSAQTEYQQQHPDSPLAWVYLDDYGHWFEHQMPDLLLLGLRRDLNGGLVLDLQIIEAKCVGQDSFEREAKSAQKQAVQGVNRLGAAWQPGANHLDAPYWYDQLYKAVTGSMVIELEQAELWKQFQDVLPVGDYRLEMSSQCWVLCHDGTAEVPADREWIGGEFAERSEFSGCPLRYRHYGRAGLQKVLLRMAGEQAAEASSEQPEVSIPPAKGTERERQDPYDMGSGEQLPVVMPIGNGNDSGNTARETEPEAEANELDELKDWMLQKVYNLNRFMRDYNVAAYQVMVEDAEVGPSIVRFRFRLRPGEQVSKLKRLASDAARVLALISPPFIDNVPGTTYVGIDLPRAKSRSVPLVGLLHQLGSPPPAELPVLLGVKPDGQVIVEDLAEFPHLLVAGATNSGKSVFLRNLLICIVHCYPPGALQLVIVDPKRTDFTFFDGLPYLRNGEVLVDSSRAREALLELVRQEMPRRQRLMHGRSMKIKDFNARFPKEALPPIVAVIDEYAQLLSTMPNKRERDAFEAELMQLAAVARATGIHLVLATQRPSADVVTGTLRANLPTSIAFKVANSTNSQIILDQAGAENLLGYGDMLFKRASGEILRLQAPYAEEGEIQQLLDERRLGIGKGLRPQVRALAADSSSLYS